MKQGREARFPGWSDGLNNVAREDLLDARQLRKALNIDLLPGGHPRRRQGYTKLLGNGQFHSLFSTLDLLVFVRDGQLCISPDGQSVQEITEVSGPLTGEIINDEFYFSDGTTTGILSTAGQLRPLGIVSPNRQPDVSAASEGGLFAGGYQVAITYLSNTGVESGTGRAAVVTVPEGGGIQLSNIPQSSQAEVVAIRVYVSDPDGEHLYFRTQLAAGTASAQIGYLRGKKKLNTQFLEAMPPADQFCHFNGRLYAAVSSMLIFSDPMNFGHYHQTEGYLPFSSAIRGVKAVDEGLFVSDSKAVHFLRGQRPDDFSLTTVQPTPAQPGTMANVDGGLFNESLAATEVAVWWSAEGHLVVGLPDGSIQRVKEADIAVPQYEQGTVAEVHREGVKQLVSVMKNPGMRSSTAFEDSATIEVHRNGIEI